MERADGGPLWFLTIIRLLCFGNEFANAFMHFARGLIREFHSKNVLRGNAALDHVRDPISDDPRLASAGPRQNQYWTAQRLDGQTLLGVERSEIQHRTQSLVCAEANSSALPRDDKNYFSI